MHRALLLLVVACGDGGRAAPDAVSADAAIDARTLPAFRNAVSMDDDALAQAAVKIVSTQCSGCHGITRQNLSYWRGLSDVALASCLTDLDVTTAQSAQRMIDCLRAMPELPESDFSTKKLGIYSTAVALPWFEYTSWKAYGDAGAAKLVELQASVGMPKDAPALAQSEFDIVAEWFARGLPRLDETLPTDPPPSTCTPSISSEVGAHVAAMTAQGWRATNAASLMAMHGCGAATDPKQCLASVPALAGHPQLRLLAEVDYATSYWTRSSPDGRFLAHGVQNVPGSYVIDLQRDAMRVPIAAHYDPAWFPDNSGFVFQGASRNTCGQSVLTSNPDSVSMTESACTSILTIGLYEHVGAVLGGDYFAIDSAFVSDDGGHEPTLRDPLASFDADAHLSFIPLMWTGTKYAAGTQVTIKTPFEGDTVMAPSAKLVLTRVAGPDDAQLGFVLREVVATPAGTSYTFSTPEIARYCFAGGKPAFSFDERWLVYHHYVTADDAVELGFTGPSDPAFQPYLTAGAANLYLVDLRDGVPRRITNMAPGQYALFPHFRSDGWIYAAIRDRTTGHEYMVASDAALLAE